jgi:hypothetical protein
MNIERPEHIDQGLWDRFWSKTHPAVGRSRCIIWIAGVQTDGYGQFGIKGKNIVAHRVVYGWLVGEVDGEKHIHHTCGNRLCVNPEHLKQLSAKEHLLLGNSPPSKNSRKTHCLNGHPLSGGNLYLDKSGHRSCKICGLTYNKAWNAAHPKVASESSRRSREKNPDYYKEWLEAHPGYHKQWRADHPDYYKQYRKQPMPDS